MDNSHDLIVGDTIYERVYNIHNIIQINDKNTHKCE